MNKRIVILSIIFVFIIALLLGIIAGQEEKIIQQKNEITMLQVETDSLKETVYQQQLTLNKLKEE